MAEACEDLLYRAIGEGWDADRLAEAAAALDVTQRALEGLLRRGRLFLLARLRRGKE